jgi:hypothetical protein
VHLGIDLIPALTPKRHLDPVSRRRQVQEAAHVDERARDGEPDVASEPRLLDLCRLAHPLGVEQRREDQRQQADGDAAGG